jgi:ATP-dependent protease ClpP protease subunit
MAEDNEGTSAAAGRNLIYSGEVSNKLLVFLAEHICSFGGDETAKSPRLILNSFGGDVYAMNAIIDFMEMHGDITTIATGSCMSAAVPIIAAGKKGKRVATRRTRFMLHAGWTSYDRPLYIDYLRNEIDELALVEKLYAEALFQHTGHQTAAWWLKFCNSDPCKYLSPEEAIDLGIIDAVVEDPTKVRPPSPAKKKKPAKKKPAKKTRKKR